MPDAEETWTSDDAKRVFDEWKQTGEPLATFCRRHGYTPERLYYWRRQLAAEPTKGAPLTLVPAMIVGAAARATPITIRLPNGIGIEAAGAAPEWIAAVVAELSRSS